MAYNSVQREGQDASFGKVSEITKKKKNQKEYVKACLTAKKKGEFEGVRLKVKGAYIYQKQRNLEDLDEVYLPRVPDKSIEVNHGLVVVQDKSSKDIVLVVKCIPFQKMTMEELEENQKVTSTLMKVRKGASLVKCNKPKRTGQMYAIGWRGGSDPGLTLGRYVPSKDVPNDVSGLENWKQEQALLSDISTIYAKKFYGLAPSLFEQTKLEVRSAGVPTLSELEFNMIPTEEATFCSNLTYTMDDFSNTFHKDADFNTYTFGMWAPISSDTGYLLSQENGFQSRGGQFLLGSYGVHVDFSKCDGVVEMIWRGKSDFHCTVPSITTSGCTRIASSLQVSEKLVQRMKALKEMHMKGVNILKRVRGVNEIVDLKLKKIK